MPEVELLLTGFTFNTDQGRLGLSTVVLIRGQRTILVDTGPMGRRDLLFNALKQRGLTPEAIQMVVLTHAHWDHTQNVDLFPRATFVIHPAEMDYARNPKPNDWATARYFVDTLRGKQVREAAEGEELEPGVRVLETPGHTKGHISLLVETSGGRVAIAGDAIGDAYAALQGKPYLIFWDEQAAIQSVQKIFSHTHTLYPGHDRPFRIHPEGKVEYLGGDTGIRIFGNLGWPYGDAQVTLGALVPPRQVLVVR